MTLFAFEEFFLLVGKDEMYSLAKMDFIFEVSRLVQFGHDAFVVGRTGSLCLTRLRFFVQRIWS